MPEASLEQRYLRFRARGKRGMYLGLITWVAVQYIDIGLETARLSPYASSHPVLKRPSSTANNTTNHRAIQTADMAPDSTQVIQSKGKYLGLPTFPSSLKNLRAIVAGANGISGQHMLRALSEEPERWSRIYALSRRPPLEAASLGPIVKHLAVDFLSTPEEIAKTLQEENVQAYVL